MDLSAIDLSEATAVRLAAAGVVLVLVVGGAVAVRAARRRRERFAALARALGGEVVRENAFSFRAAVRCAGRTWELRSQHLGGNAPGFTHDWYFITRTTLAGVLDTHRAEIRPRRRDPSVDADDAAAFDRAFAVGDFGYPLRDGWRTRDVRRAVAAFYAGRGPALEKLELEQGALVHRSRSLLRRLAADDLRRLLERQAGVAAALEDALR